MKRLNFLLCVAIFFVFLVLSQDAFAKGGVHKSHNKKCDEKVLQADKEKIAEDGKEIQADKQVLKEAKKSKDKVKIKQAKEKLNQDIQKEKKDKVALDRDIG